MSGMIASRALRYFGVAAFLAFAVLLVMAPASAQGITGGCSANVNGRSPESLTEDSPLVVQKNDSISIKGSVPGSVASAGAQAIASRTDTYVDVFGFPLKVKSTTGKGASWGGVVKLPKLIRDLAAGLYRVSGDASGSPGGWECSGSAYIKLDNEPLTSPTTYVGAALGAGGLIVAARARGRKKRPSTMGGTIVDATREIIPDAKATFGADAAAIVLLVILLLIFLIIGLLDPSVALLVPLMNVPDGNDRSIWVKGSAVGGFFGGLLLGLGIALLCQQFAISALDRGALAFLVAAAVLGAVRGWRGRAFTTRPVEPAAT